MSFRDLTLEELNLFEQEFREFLAVNGIDASLWSDIKKDQPNKVDEIISSFSKVIFNSVLLKLKYVEFGTENDIKYFYYGKDEAELIGLESDTVNLTEKGTVLAAIKEKKASIKVYRTSKKYKKKREEELFEMLKNGCQPCDGKIFKLLQKLVYKQD